MSASVTAIFVRCLAGLVNPRWTFSQTMLNQTTLNGARFRYAGVAMMTGATYALLFALPHAAGLRESFAVGLIVGVPLVVWRSQVVRREINAEK